MSLATRCTACGTVFRVVQDQLKVSEGWVRCGRCSEVFNALEGLFDLERETAPEWSAPPTPRSTGSETAAVSHEFGVDDSREPPDPSLLDRIDAQLLSSHRKTEGSTPAARVGERDRRDFPDAQFDPEFLMDDATADETGFSAVLPSDGEAAPFRPPAAPEFIRHAQRQARWRSPKMRAVLCTSALALLAALALQVGHHFRDLIAARWPVLVPTLTAWCGVATCSIESPRRIEDVSVESSALTRASAAEAFKLSVTLRNRGAMTLALPSVDLSLTDPTGQLVARRVLMPHDFRVASELMQPNADAVLQLLLATGNAQVTGYTVEIFYP
jgi:predicted Zn finger-like uncharacterized protein